MSKEMQRTAEVKEVELATFLVNCRTMFGHIYVALGFDFNTMTGDLYDTGSQSFINQLQHTKREGILVQDG